MSSFESPYETGRGFGVSTREMKVISGASALMAINVLLMYVLSVTPLAVVNEFLFAVPIIGVLVYGAAIMVGELVAERGVKGGNLGTAFVGMVILQLAFGVFGAGVLSFAPPDSRLVVLGVTAIVVAVVTAAISTYVYARSKDFDRWGTAANFSFLGGVVAIAIGTIVPALLLVGFVLIFLGFLLRLGWEIWRVREHRRASVALQTIGVYIAVAGVFVHVLQLVLRYLISRE